MREKLLCMTSALMLIAAAAQSRACVSAALVLAVDGSDSVNDEDAFQKNAIAHVPHFGQQQRHRFISRTPARSRLHRMLWSARSSKSSGVRIYSGPRARRSL